MIREAGKIPITRACENAAHMRTSVRCALGATMRAQLTERRIVGNTHAANRCDRLSC